MKFLPFTTLALCVLLVACANEPEVNPVEKAEDESGPRLVGRVASIPADRKFVLIQSYGHWTVETGSILTTQGPEGRAANLIATGEKLGQYAAADVRTGTLEIGDGVYTIAKTATTKDETAEPVAAENSVAPPASETTD